MVNNIAFILYCIRSHGCTEFSCFKQDNDRFLRIVAWILIEYFLSFFPILKIVAFFSFFVSSKSIFHIGHPNKVYSKRAVLKVITLGIHLTTSDNERNEETTTTYVPASTTVEPYEPVSITAEPYEPVTTTAEPYEPATTTAEPYEPVTTAEVIP